MQVVCCIDCLNPQPEADQLSHRTITLGRTLEMDVITALVDGEQVETNSTRIVPWWSYTKTIISAAALSLVDRALLSLDDAVAGRSFSLRQLLQHRSGLPDYGFLPAYHDDVGARRTPWTVDEMLERCQINAPLFAPGMGWSYSNIGYVHVRRLIEQATQQPLLAALEDLVLRPLGIGDVRLALSPADLDATAWGNPQAYHPGWVYHGLLVGTASSAALLLQRLMEGRLLTQAMMEAMLTMHRFDVSATTRPLSEPCYGLGIMGGNAGHSGYRGHTGTGPGSVAAIYGAWVGDTATSLRTAAVFAPGEDQAAVERKAIELISTGSVRR